MTRRKGVGGGWLKWLVGAVIVLVILVVVALVALPSLVPVDTIRDRVVSAVHDATGRDLAIKGGMTVSIFPTLAVTAKDVTFSNASWAGQKPMVSLSSLDVRLKVIPLISGKVEVASFVLDRPEIDLETDKQGHGNWEMAPPAGAAAAKANAPAAPATSSAAGGKTPAAGGGGGIPEISLGDVHISNGHLVYKDGVSGQTESFDAVNLKISLPDLDSPLAVDGSLRFRDKDVNLTVNAAKPRAMMAVGGSPVSVKLVSDPVKLDFSGTLALAGAPRGAIDIDLSTPSVRDLAAWATGKPLAMPGNGLGSMSLKGKALLDANRIALNGLQLTLDNAKATGELAVDTGGARPSLKGQLAVDHLDLNSYLPPEGGAKGAAGGGGGASGNAGAAKPASGQSGWSEDPIDVSPLKSADVDLGLAADSIVYRKIEIGKSTLKITLAGGQLSADLANMSLYQGNVQGRVQVDGAGAVPAVKVNLKLDKVQLKPLLAATSGSDQLSGAAVGDIDVAGQGHSQKEIVSTLAGKGRFELQNGVLRGIDLQGIVKNAAQSLTGGSGVGQTEFKKASGTFTMTNGIAKNDDLAIETDLMTVAGTGTIDLPKRTLDYKVTPKLAGAVPLPLIIQGPWDNISWRPDVSGIVPKDIGGAGKALNAITNQKGGGAGGAVGGALNKLLR